jgi:hypothetical protein
VALSLEDNTELIKKVLGASYIPISIKEITIKDFVESKGCSVYFVLNTGQEIECSGLGMVDAIFSGLKEVFSGEFYSFGGLHLQKFEAKAVSVSLDSKVSVLVQVKNSYGNLISFEDCSHSLIASATRVCANIAEYFINSHKAFKLLLTALEEAKQRNRQDLVVKYTMELAAITRSTSYEEF